MVKIINNPILSLLLFCSFASHGQSPNEVPAIFQNPQPISIQLNFSLKEIEKSRSDTVYFASYLNYKNENDTWDSLHIGIRARGNFRRKYCSFPPLRLKIKKPDAKSTPFEGNKSFKLVLPCQGGKSGNNLILKEYLCYKLLEVVTPYYFHTRLTDISLTDQSGKHLKSYLLTGFLIEDDDLIADRLNGNIIEQVVPQMQLNDTATVVNDFFEYLIANTDWSITAQHNAKILQLPHNKKVPLSYDFDMAGLVNAPYATFAESLPIANVQERIYRGYCRKESVMEYVRSEYLRLQPALMKVMDDHQSHFNEKEFIQMKIFIDKFFSILKNDPQFRNEIVMSCRTK